MLFYSFYNKSSLGGRMHQDLLKQNNQLKLKYKKSLQELMHILKINNLLKENMNKNDSAINVQLREQIEIIKSQHQGQIQKRLLQQKQLLQKINKELQQKLDDSQTERNELKQKLSNKKESSNNQSQKSFEQDGRNNSNKYQKDPNYSRNKFLQSLQKEKERISLQEEIRLLKEKEKQLTLELLTLKQKYRNDIVKKDQQNMKRKESDQQKLEKIKCKCNQLQNQLNSYKYSQKYYQLEVKPLFDYQQILDDMHQKFKKINNDDFDYSKSGVKSEQVDEKAKVMYLQAQNQRLKIQQCKLNKKIKQQQINITKSQKLQQQFNKLQSQKIKIFQQNNILQTLLITQRYRQNENGLSEKIKQFETRIKLMISQKDGMEGYGGYQQITILKGYIIQLSQTLNRLKRRQQQLHKKNQGYKNKFSELQISCIQKIEKFNKRIADYDSLINKLYEALEEKIKSNIPEDTEKEFSNAIQRYEEKIIVMSEQIILLRKTNQQLLTKGQSTEQSNSKYSRIDELQQQNSSYRKLVDEFKNKVQSLQYEYSSLSSRVTTKIKELQKQIDDKSNMIDTLTIENEKLINFNNEKFKDMQQKILDYEEYIIELRNQESKAAVLPNNSDPPHIQLLHRRSISIDSINSNNAQQQIKILNSQIVAQTSQIRQYKRYINQIQSELQRYKSNLLHKINELSVIELQQNVKNMEKQKRQIQCELEKLIKRYNNQEIEWKEDVENLKYQNRGLIQQLNSKQNELMVYYDQLNKSNHFQQRENQFNHDLSEAQLNIQKLNTQIKELRAQNLTFRTNNITLKNQLQSKEDIVNELKHQIFKAELQSQRAKSSGSILKETKNEMQYQTLLVLLVMTFAEVESLRQTNQELNLTHEKAEAKDKSQRSRFSKSSHRNTFFENISMQDSIQAPVYEENQQSESQKFSKNEFLKNKDY